MYVCIFRNTWDPNHMGLRAENYINLRKKVMLLLWMNTYYWRENIPKEGDLYDTILAYKRLK